MSFTTSGVSCDDTSSEGDAFSEVSLFLLDNDLSGSLTPSPTSDFDDFVILDDEDEDVDLPSVSPLLNHRPETSTSTLLSFPTDGPEDVTITLPTFLVHENPHFFNDECASEPSSIRRFEWWCDETMPRHQTFAVVNAIELVRNPRVTRSAPEIPSLFKKREVGCGFCRSSGHCGWENHTRQKCRQLRELAPCKICGAQGEFNHTETYCPEKPPVSLPLTGNYLQNLTSRRATRDFRFFSKYMSLIDQLYSCDI